MARPGEKRRAEKSFREAIVNRKQHKKKPGPRSQRAPKTDTSKLVKHWQGQQAMQSNRTGLSQVNQPCRVIGYEPRRRKSKSREKVKSDLLCHGTTKARL